MFEMESCIFLSSFLHFTSHRRHDLQTLSQHRLPFRRYSENWKDLGFWKIMGKLPWGGRVKIFGIMGNHGENRKRQRLTWTVGREGILRWQCSDRSRSRCRRHPVWRWRNDHVGEKKNMLMKEDSCWGKNNQDNQRRQNNCFRAMSINAEFAEGKERLSKNSMQKP